ncbi:MAG: protein translocase subunit SecF [Actinomycetota bacterium]|nr:protein translocase subunit SecF [Actinomycetota bacterium]
MSGGLSRIYRGETHVDFIGKRRIWFAISAVVVALCLGSLLTKGLNYGIEFAGGVSIQAPIAEDGPLAGATDLEVTAELREALGEFGAEGAQIQIASTEDRRTAVVQTKEVADPEQQALVVAAVGETVGASVEETDSSRIGSKWGAEITRKALRALVIFLLVVFAFISWRFEWKMAIASIVALIHDLLITAGVYSLVGFEVTPSSVIAILTILGYSLYDTVVVFDKVEETTVALASSGRMTYQDSANVALNQVFMRSLNTSLSTLLPISALLFIGAGFLGAETLKDLALALLVGTLVGTYSSIFVATPLLSVWKEREPKYRNVREKVLRQARARAEGEPALAGGEIPERTPVTASAVTGSPASRPRAGAKKAKRRKKR